MSETDQTFDSWNRYKARKDARLAPKVELNSQEAQNRRARVQGALGMWMACHCCKFEQTFTNQMVCTQLMGKLVTRFEDQQQLYRYIKYCFNNDIVLQDVVNHIDKFYLTQ